MALITAFRRTSKNRHSVHGKVECMTSAFTSAGKVYLQLDTGGSPTRKLKGKTSQTIQLDAAGARQLVTILRATFALS